jgi:hypothetical protein
MRATNPDWSNDGKKIAFVAGTNGLRQLYLFEIENLFSSQWNDYFVDKNMGTLLYSSDENQANHKFQVKGGSLKQLLVLPHGNQIYHPRWSPDDKRLVMGTSTDYARDIAVYNLTDQSFEKLLSGKEELRYPVFHPVENILYYTSGETGIYNLYKLDLNNDKRMLLTNVTGGAVMPDVNLNNELVYSNYDSLGYHIYTITDQKYIDLHNAIYERGYISTIPDKNFDDSVLPDWEVKPYKQQFTGLHILPRLVIDYGTVKPGLYLFANDVLDKMTIIAGADVNTKFDYDLYGIFEYREYFPTLFIEAYNLSQNIADTVNIRTGAESEIIEQDINFDLTEIQVGLRFYLPEKIQWRLLYRISLYHAKLEWYDPFAEDILNFRYRYLNGHAVELRIQADLVKENMYQRINPSSGRFVQLKFTHENNDFLVDFDTGKNTALEVFKKYTFNKIELDWEEYFSNPLIKNHAFSIRLQAGYIDRSVDEFFYLWAGGLLGMKGYSYFSIGGTKKLITTLTYRFPLFDHLDWQVFNLYFNKLYLGFFYDYGNAWDEDKITLSNFKDDIGIQLRLDVYSNYLFPTKVFWEAVYPLDRIDAFDVIYENNWRFYFGILFEFDFRERNRSHISSTRRPRLN